MALADMHLLSLLVFMPLLGALILAFLPAAEKGLLRGFALAWSLLVFCLALVVLWLFVPSKGDFQLVESMIWIPDFGISYSLGLDGISLWLVMLTAFLTPLTLLSTFKAIERQVKGFMFSMLLLETAMLGTLLATDLFLFYLFWELMLIPMYFLIGIWGGENRLYATIKFVLYTMVGSLLMLLALIALAYYHAQESGHPSMEWADLMQTQLPFWHQVLLFSGFALAFAIKVPMWPFHTWLPDAHTEAPTAGSVILAGVLLKMGVYGFLRFAIPLFPHAAGAALPYLAALATIGIIYGALLAWVQKDVKRLVAYSSVSHLGYCMLGIAAMSVQAFEGSILQMVNHGLSTGALFLLVGIIYERRHTRLISEFGGLATVMPAFAAFFVITTLSSIGLPGLNGFVGEFLILLGSFRSELLPYAPLFTTVASAGVLLGAIYMLSMVQRVFFGPLNNPKNEGLRDLELREYLVLIPLVIMMAVIGLAPNFFLRPMDATLEKLCSDYKARVAVEPPTFIVTAADKAAARGKGPRVFIVE